MCSTLLKRRVSSSSVTTSKARDSVAGARAPGVCKQLGDKCRRVCLRCWRHPSWGKASPGCTRACWVGRCGLPSRSCGRRNSTSRAWRGLVLGRCAGEEARHACSMGRCAVPRRRHRETTAAAALRGSRARAVTTRGSSFVNLLLIHAVRLCGIPGAGWLCEEDASACFVVLYPVPWLLLPHVRIAPPMRCRRGAPVHAYVAVFKVDKRW
jgi:hypothetical protein